MKEWVLDLHIHSILSPCADESMVPPLILDRAKQLGTEVLAITDHNCAENVPAFMSAGEKAGVVVWPGMEVQTKEDVHVICLFDTLEQLLSWQDIVYRHLPAQKNKKESFGEQWVVDQAGNKIHEVEKLLLLGANLTIEEVVGTVHNLNGLCIAAHIDRQDFSLWGNLGFIPPNLPIDGVELTPYLPRDSMQLAYLRKNCLTYIVSSDAHWLDALYPPICCALMEECNLGELKLALSEKDGRCIRTIR